MHFCCIYPVKKCIVDIFMLAQYNIIQIFNSFIFICIIYQYIIVSSSCTIEFVCIAAAALGGMTIHTAMGMTSYVLILMCLHLFKICLCRIMYTLFSIFFYIIVKYLLYTTSYVVSVLFIPIHIYIHWSYKSNTSLSEQFNLYEYPYEKLLMIMFC